MFHREFKNDLTEKLSNDPRFSVSNFLAHPNFQATVKNDPDTLINWTAAPDPTRPDRLPRICTLIDWALSLTHNTGAHSNNFRGNYRSCHYLSSPSRRLWSRLLKLKKEDGVEYPFKVLHNFINTQYARSSPRLAGHYQLILECWLRSSSNLNDWFPPAVRESVINGLLLNIDIVAFQSLLCHFLVDFQEDIFQKLPNLTVASVIGEIARQAAVSTFRIRDAAPDLPGRLSAGNELAMWRSKARTPLLNWERKEIPIPPYAKFSKSPPNQEARDFPRRLSERQRLAGYDAGRWAGADDVEGAYQRAYLQLSVLQSVLRESPQAAEKVRDLGCMRFLLMCGIYADSVSMISKLAFRILKWLVYGYKPPADTDEVTDFEIPPAYGDHKVRELVDEYARDFVFCDEITPQMANAFALFWNHRYAELSRGDSWQQQRVQLYGRDGKTAVGCFVIERRPGETPLEHFGRYLLDEPQMNDAFNVEIRDVLLFLDRWGAKIRYPERPPDTDAAWLEYSRKVTEFDVVYFEFLRTRFGYGEKVGDMGIALDALSLIDPDYWAHKVKPPPALNGSVLWLLEFMADSEFFNDLNGPTELARMAPKINDVNLGLQVFSTKLLIDDFDALTTLNEQGGGGGEAGRRRNGRDSFRRYGDASPPDKK